MTNVIDTRPNSSEQWCLDLPGVLGSVPLETERELDPGAIASLALWRVVRRSHRERFESNSEAASVRGGAAMSDVESGMVDRGDEDEARERAVSAFLYLGEKLRRFYRGPRTDADEPSRLPAEGADTLFRAIEGEIIPRLLLAHQVRDMARDMTPAESPPSVESVGRIKPQDHVRLLESVLHDSAAATRAIVHELLERGVPLERVFIDLLGRAARRLGELWEEDRCSFADVTIALCRLHEVVREQSTGGGATVSRSAGPRILLATACADQHAFGLVMVAEFFRRAGWHVWSEPGASRDELASILHTSHFDVLGLSAACTSISDDVASEIATLRKASSNPAMRVLVGGRLFAEAPELAGRIGADAVALDAEIAPDVGRELLPDFQALR